MADTDYAPDSARRGTLPPWELAKAVAYQEVLRDIEAETGISAAELVGKRVDEYIASKVTLQGGGSPTSRALRKALARVRDPEWYPGKPPAAGAGRPPVYSDHTRQEVARVAMSLKRARVAPTPRRVRARLPGVARNPETGVPMADATLRKIFTSLCYDVDEDDPWQFLTSPAQDALPEELVPRRAACARYIIRYFAAGAWYSHVSIDPCASLLPLTMRRLEEQRVAAMGKKKYMSPGARRQGVNLRAPATAKTQKSNDVLQVHWTPVFARGKVRIHVCDPAKTGPRSPGKLNDAANLALFVRHVLPGILKEMQETYGWPNVPRTVVHDKASYMVTATHERLHHAFAGALTAAGFTSWVGGPSACTQWLVSKWSDVYVHETLISHIRRLLYTEYMCSTPSETVAHFMGRMRRVEAHLNSPEFSMAGGRGLDGLARDMLARCHEVVKRKGQRIPK